MRTTSSDVDEPYVVLRWVGGRVEVRPLPDPQDLDWLYRLADSDTRLLRAIVVEPVPLEGDDDWGGPSLFATNIVCFKGYHEYPAYWYQETVRVEPVGDAAPPKKGKKK